MSKQYRFTLVKFAEPDNSDIPSHFHRWIVFVKSERWCLDVWIDVVHVLLSPSSRALRQVLSATEWTRTCHRTAGASLMWKRKLEESSLRSTSMRSPVSPLRSVAVIMVSIVMINFSCFLNVLLPSYYYYTVN